MMIEETLREPWRDIRAQWLAMLDPAHPKDAMWISHGTPRPAEMPGDVLVIETDGGMLLTNNPAKAQYFVLRPTVEGVADVLGYLEPKSAIDPAKAVMVQAADLSGAIIHEMVVSLANVARAVEIIRRYGQVIVAPLEAAMARRILLVHMEG